MDEFDKNEEVKNVYANFDLAIYTAQCLEHGLLNALIFLKLMPLRDSVLDTKEWEYTFDSFSAKHIKHTLGQIIKDFETVANIPSDFSDNLSRALKIRNRLSHDFFRERAQDFIFSNGRKDMILELQEASDVLFEVDTQITNMLEPLRIKYGITEEVIEKTYQEMMLKNK